MNNIFKDNYFKMIITDNNLYIDNYTKILTIDEKYVLIKVKNKTISIKGNNISLNRVLSNELLLKGNIYNIEVKDE